jgi:sugar lactone lactonase YvrE
MHRIFIAALIAALPIGCATAPQPSQNSTATVAASSAPPPGTSQSTPTPASLGRVRATLPDSTFWPEGMDYDPRTGRYYVASVRHRTVAEVSPSGATRELWPRGRPDLGALLGVRVDPVRGILWATTSGIPQQAAYTAGDSGVAALLRIRIADGAIERRWDLPVVPKGHTLGDLAVGPSGDVYVTDSNEPVVYRLRPGADTLEHFTNPLFKSLQGLAPTPDGRVLYLADYSRGLLRVDLASNAVTLVADSTGRSPRGCDGIAFTDGSIVAVQNGASPARVIRIDLDATGTRVAGAALLDSDPAVADEPTIGAVVGQDFVYVANSQWEKHDRAGALVPGAVLRRPLLVATPIRR